jgi:segregation and condensation protein A
MYRVALDTFHGPLDLLLYLVKRNEVDVLDVPLGRLTDQFLDYLRVLPEVDVELAGDFLVMAATLMEIKSRSLLPAAASVGGEAEADPRRELVRQLLEYRKFKDAAAALQQQAEAHATRLPRLAVEEFRPESGSAPAVRPVELWDLVSAFARLMRETRALAPTTIAVDDTPQHVYEELVMARVASERRVAFRAVFTPPFTKARLIGLFLAVLELIKRTAIWLEQSQPFGDIWLLEPDRPPT